MKRLVILVFVVLAFFWSGFSVALVKGIYITQSTLEDTAKLDYLIQRANSAGIAVFIVDLDRPSRRYEANIQRVKQSNIMYVARIVMFPGGGTPEQVKSMEYRDKKYRLVQQAINYGADQIQLDYIRYNTKQPGVSQNAKDIYKIIEWFKVKLAEQNIPLQVDVFGISSFGEAKYIGQNIQLFSSAVDVLCPMVYPSHYEPFMQHAVTPYETVRDSLMAIRAQFDDGPLPFKLVPYIELSNYRYKLSQSKKLDYIYAQIKAAQDAGADGWFAWSPNNHYDNLFNVLEHYQVK